MRQHNLSFAINKIPNSKSYIAFGRVRNISAFCYLCNRTPYIYR